MHAGRELHTRLRTTAMVQHQEQFLHLVHLQQVEALRRLQVTLELLSEQVTHLAIGIHLLPVPEQHTQQERLIVRMQTLIYMQSGRRLLALLLIH